MRGTPLALRCGEVPWPPLEIRFFAIQAARTFRPRMRDVLHAVLGGYQGAWNSPAVQYEEVPRPPLEIRIGDPSCPDLPIPLWSVSTSWTGARGTPSVLHGDEGVAAAAGDTLFGDPCCPDPMDDRACKEFVKGN